MKLKTAIFYQSVKNWDNNESNTFKEDPTQIIELEDHLVKVSKEGRKEVIIVPTANLRYAIADYAEAYRIIEPQPSNLLEIPDSSLADQADEICKEELNSSETPTSSKKKKANAKQ